MSNFLALATVTAALRRLLQGAIAEDVGGAVVTTLRPDDSGTGLPLTGVNLFLYQATPNPDLRNLDLPTRRADSSLIELPQEAVDLNYMITFHGDEATLEPQRLLGSVTRTLRAQPVLSRQLIEDTLADPAFGFLAGSDLADAIERVRLVPVGLGLDEQSQIWSGIFANVPYHLSVVYRASVVLLTAESERPSGALPVRQRQILLKTFRQPVVETVQAVSGRLEPIVVGTELRLTGRRLQADVTRVRFGGQELEPDSTSDREITFTLDAPTIDPSALRAGVRAVQVLQPFLVGTPPEQRSGVESSATPVVLRPAIVSASAANVSDLGDGTVSAEINVQVMPPVGARQRLSLLLNPAPGSIASSAHSFRAPSRTLDTSSLTITITGVAPGDYLVRLQVDGAESVLVTDEVPTSPTFEQYIAPAISVILP